MFNLSRKSFMPIPWVLISVVYLFIINTVIKIVYKYLLKTNTFLKITFLFKILHMHTLIKDI